MSRFRSSAVNPGDIGPGSDFFAAGIDGTEVAIIGGGLAGTGFPSPVVLARIDVEVGIVSAATQWKVSFTGSAAIAGGFVPANHLVEATTGCDIQAPLLGLSLGQINVATCPDNFVRGDCNNNGRVVGLVGDFLYILNWIFVGSVPDPRCAAACDSNADNSIEITDAIYLVNFMSGLGPAPSAPFPDCGPTPISTTLTCDVGVCP
jgi:hypothetical protein